MTRHLTLAATAWAVTLAVAGAACGSDAPAAAIEIGDGGRYAPTIDPGNFVDHIDNPMLPMTPGERWVYEGTEDGVPVTIEVTVTNTRRTVMGIEAFELRDTVRTSGDVIEDTWDWYAQDRDGNVWYLGEDSKEYEKGRVTSTHGSWEAGVDGVLPGIVMPANPTVGLAYRQEFFKGEAEDLAEVIRVGSDEIVIREWNPLDPEAIEEKSYRRGVGMVLVRKTRGGEARVVLVEHTRPPGAPPVT